MITKTVKLLQNLLELNRATENLLIDIVASYSPWIAPLIPAFLTFRAMINYLGFPVWAGFAAAICVETLGLSSIQTAVSFWQWNDSKAKSDPRAPVILAILTGGFYLLTVLTVNAMLDNAPLIYKLAKALLSSLSVCAGVILALRAGHARRLLEAERARQERREERTARRLEKQSLGKVLPFLQTIPGNGNGAHREVLTQ